MDLKNYGKQNKIKNGILQMKANESHLIWIPSLFWSAQQELIT